MEAQEPISKTELSFEIYDKFNSKFVPCTYCKFCDEEKESLEKQETWVINLCYQLARNLQFISDRGFTDPNIKDKHCKELTYWVHDEIINAHGINELSKYSEIISKLHRPWNLIISSSKADKDKICKTDTFIYNFAEENLKKKMDDYCKNYPIISQELDKNDADCKPYYKYLTDSSSVHKEIIKGCRKLEGKKYCPPNGDNCLYHPPSEFLNKNACKIINDARSIETKADEKEMTCAPCPLCPIGRVKEEMESEGDLETHRLPIPEESTSFDFSDKRAIFLLVFSVWGILLTLFLFYKKTPFGLWFKNFLRRKKVIQNNFKENEFHEFLDEDYDTADSNIEHRRYDLTYNPT
ncbi:PIR Superfamily Protein [Plasmodium ovale curtisi]|uniref:PIR Superfamily Protein n=1 Tax=Plasmodium ovale curtisi TaxID=864141 RepID=A0A1A8VTF6_PLAOA|nr:PIR Superfamily Protein [Plasmodium ovale curtisi]